MHLLPIKEADPVCDVCIRDYMQAGMLVEIGDFLHDNKVSDLMTQVGIFKKSNYDE